MLKVALLSAALVVAAGTTALAAGHGSGGHGMGGHGMGNHGMNHSMGHPGPSMHSMGPSHFSGSTHFDQRHAYRGERFYGHRHAGLGLGLGVIGGGAYAYESCWRWHRDYYGRLVRRYVCDIDDYYRW